MLTREELSKLATKYSTAFFTFHEALNAAANDTIKRFLPDDYKAKINHLKLDYDYDFKASKKGPWYVSFVINALADDGSKETGLDIYINSYADHISMNVGSTGTFTRKENPLCITTYRLINFIWENDEFLYLLLKLNLEKQNVFELEEDYNRLAAEYSKEDNALRAFERAEVKRVFFEKLAPGVILYNKSDFEAHGHKIYCYKVVAVCKSVIKAYPYSKQWNFQTSGYDYLFDSTNVKKLPLAGLEHSYLIFD